MTDTPYRPRSLRVSDPTGEDIDALLERAYALRSQDSRQMLALAEEAQAQAEHLGDAARSASALLHAAMARNGLADYPAALELARSAAIRFAQLGDGDNEGRALNSVGNALWRLGDFAGAQSHYETSLGLARKLGNLQREASVLNNLGNVAADQGHYPEAMQFYLDSMEVATRAGDKEHAHTVLNNLGETYEKLGDLAEALESHLECQRQIPDSDHAAAALSKYNIGRLYYKLGDPDSGLAHFQESLRLSRIIGNRHYESLALSSIGEIEEQLGRHDGARHYYEEAIGLQRQTGDKAGMIETLRHLGALRQRTGDGAGALQNLENSLQLAQALGDPYQLVQTLIAHALQKLTQGDPATARAETETALSQAEHQGFQEQQLDAHRALSAILEAQGDAHAALGHLRAAGALDKTLFSETAGRRIQQLTARHQMERSRQEAEIARLKNVELASANRDLADLNATLQQLNAEKSELLATVQRLAIEDALTGLYNRRHFDTALRAEFERAQRFGRNLSLAMADLDHFKNVNDRFLHQTGDSVLQIIANILRQSVRGVDIIARYGGEEFVLLFPETGVEAAARVCEKIRAQIAAYPWNPLALGLVVTISIGLSDDLSQGPEELVRAADRKLYEAKNAGRNRLIA